MRSQSTLQRLVRGEIKKKTPKSCFLAFRDYDLKNQYLSLKRLKQIFLNTAEKDSVSICI
jgi:hypothetical protein